MTDYHVLGGPALNRLIAERRGYTIRETPPHPDAMESEEVTVFALIAPNGNPMAGFNDWFRPGPERTDAAWNIFLDGNLPNWAGCLDDAWPLLWEIGGLDDALRDDFEETRTPQAAARAISERRCQDWDVEHGGLG